MSASDATRDNKDELERLVVGSSAYMCAPKVDCLVANRGQVWMFVYLLLIELKSYLLYLLDLFKFYVLYRHNRYKSITGR